MKAIIRSSAMLHPDSMKKIDEQITNDLNKKGFALLPCGFEVYLFDESSTPHEPDILNKNFIMPGEMQEDKQ